MTYIRPDETTMRRLYETERLTTRELAARLEISTGCAKNWLRSYGIERRPASIGMMSRGIEGPTREQLESMIHADHLSYEQIGARYGVDKTAITYWLKKYEITGAKIWDTRRKGVHPVLPDADELASIYNSGVGLNSIGEVYGVSGGLIAKLCDRYGIERRDSGFAGIERPTAKDGTRVRSRYELVVADWLIDHAVPFDYEPKLSFNRRMKGDFLANGWYIEVWGVTQSLAYRERKARKIQGYKDHGLPLIQLSTEHFGRRKHTLYQRLESVLIPPAPQAG